MESEKLLARFLDYISYDTQSSEEAEGCPSTPKQLDFARHLAESLEEMGLEEVEMDENAYVYATLPANTDKPVPTIGFIAHMDTSPDCSGADIHPRIINNYDGSDDADGLDMSFHCRIFFNPTNISIFA